MIHPISNKWIIPRTALAVDFWKITALGQTLSWTYTHSTSRLYLFLMNKNILNFTGSINSAVSTSLIMGNLSLVIYKILNSFSALNFILSNPPSFTNTELMGEWLIIYWVKSALNSFGSSEECSSRLTEMTESQIFAWLLFSK